MTPGRSRRPKGAAVVSESRKNGRPDGIASRRVRAHIAAVLVMAAVGCEGGREPARTPAEAVARGELYWALGLSRHADDATTLETVRAVMTKVDPEIMVGPLPDQELVARVSAHTARQIRRLAFVVRVVATAHANDPLTQATADVALEGSSEVVWRHESDGRAISAFTCEEYPLTRSETKWRMGALPTPKSGSDVVVGDALFPVLLLDALPTSSDRSPPPTREQIFAQAPSAKRRARGRGARDGVRELHLHLIRDLPNAAGSGGRHRPRRLVRDPLPATRRASAVVRSATGRSLPRSAPPALGRSPEVDIGSGGSTRHERRQVSGRSMFASDGRARRPEVRTDDRLREACEARAGS